MVKRTQIAYGLLLTGVSLLLTAAIAPGIAYARYDTAVRWNTVVETAQDPVITPLQPPILSGSVRTLGFTLTETVTDPVCSVEFLSSDQEFTAYTEDNLLITVRENTVTVAMVQTQPPAGTYRLVITWQAEGAAEQHTAAATFFINYSDV